MTRRLELTPDGPSGRRTLAEEAAAEVHELILSGELPSGTALRLEELAKRLDMSQMPIREGLRRMEALGLVEIVPHKGAWVRELSMEDLRDTYETRVALESLAVRAAAGRFTEADATLAQDALTEHVRLSKLGDLVAARQAHTGFHFTLYRAGGSRWLPRAIEPVWQNSERYGLGSRQTRSRIVQTQREHQAILDACVAHDEAAAETALRRHLDAVMQRITATMARRRQDDG
jgi:DNA-binding GntR family transcriptional regulator